MVPFQFAKSAETIIEQVQLKNNNSAKQRRICYMELVQCMSYYLCCVLLTILGLFPVIIGYLVTIQPHIAWPQREASEI